MYTLIQSQKTKKTQKIQQIEQKEAEADGVVCLPNGYMILALGISIIKNRHITWDDIGDKQHLRQ